MMMAIMTMVMTTTATRMGMAMEHKSVLLLLPSELSASCTATLEPARSTR